MPKGVFDGVILRLKAKGNWAPNDLSGDLLVKVKMAKHPYFLKSKTNAWDVLTFKYITITQAILGATVKIDTLEGTKEVSVEPGTT